MIDLLYLDDDVGERPDPLYSYIYSDQEFDDEIASIDSQTNVMDHNASNDIIDSQLNSKDNDDNDDDD